MASRAADPEHDGRPSLAVALPARPAGASVWRDAGRGLGVLAADLGRAAPTMLGVPLVLLAVAVGLGCDPPAWTAPWALAGGVGFALGDRAGAGATVGALGVAAIAGPAAVLGVAGGSAAGYLGRRFRPAVAAVAAAVAMGGVAALLALA